MDFRWVEEADPKRRTLLEMYCAAALHIPYSDFSKEAAVTGAN
jgi:predicted transcriptional regulator